MEYVYQKSKSRPVFDRDWMEPEAHLFRRPQNYVAENLIKYRLLRRKQLQ